MNKVSVMYAANFLTLLDKQMYHMYSLPVLAESTYDRILMDCYKDMIMDIRNHFIGKKYRIYEIVSFFGTKGIVVSTRNNMVTFQIPFKEIANEELRDDWKRTNTSN